MVTITTAPDGIALLPAGLRNAREDRRAPEIAEPRASEPAGLGSVQDESASEAETLVQDSTPFGNPQQGPVFYDCQITNFYYIAGGGDRSTTLGLPARTIISPIIDREDGGRLPIEVVEGMIRRPMMRHELPREFRSARADLDPEGLVIPRLRRQEAGFNRVPAPPPRPVPLCSIIPSQIPSPTFGGGRTRRAAGRRRLLYTSDADDLERPGSDSDCSTDGSSSSSEDLAIVRRNARRLRDALLTSFQDGSLRPYGNYESPGARDLASTYAVHGGRFHNNRRARDSAAETERLVQVCELGRGRAGVVADGASSAAACQPCEQVVVPETRAAAVDGEEEGGPEDARVRLLPRVSVVEDEASGRESGGVRLQ